jgi:hypothetical protein
MIKGGRRTSAEIAPVVIFWRGLFNSSNSKFGATWRAGEWNNVANVRDPSEKHKHALKTQTEAGMRNRSVAPQVEIPFVVGGIHFVMADVRLQNCQPLFALAATYYLPYSRNKQVHGCHRPAIIVRSHVKGLNLFRVIENSDWRFEVPFS